MRGFSLPAGASTNPEVNGLIGKLVRFEVERDGYTLTETTLEEAEAHWAASAKEPVVLESDSLYYALPLFDEIGFDDSIRVGAKAANLAELHQLLGTHAPIGFAVPFHYYQRAMENTLVEPLACEAAGQACPPPYSPKSP